MIATGRRLIVANRPKIDRFAWPTRAGWQVVGAPQSIVTPLTSALPRAQRVVGEPGAESGAPGEPGRQWGARRIRHATSAAEQVVAGGRLNDRTELRAGPQLGRLSPPSPTNLSSAHHDDDCKSPAELIKAPSRAAPASGQRAHFRRLEGLASQAREGPGTQSIRLPARAPAGRSQQVSVGPARIRPSVQTTSGPLARRPGGRAKLFILRAANSSAREPSPESAFEANLQNLNSAGPLWASNKFNLDAPSGPNKGLGADFCVGRAKSKMAARRRPLAELAAARRLGARFDPRAGRLGLAQSSRVPGRAQRQVSSSREGTVVDIYLIINARPPGEPQSCRAAGPRRADGPGAG